jgi:inosose dehydratase
MDPLDIVRTYRDRVDHLHVKDFAADGSWAATGTGVVDIRGVLSFLTATGYDGWVTMEDESPDAERDPDTAVLRNGDYVREILNGAGT